MVGIRNFSTQEYVFAAISNSLILNRPSEEALALTAMSDPHVREHYENTRAQPGATNDWDVEPETVEGTTLGHGETRESHPTEGEYGNVGFASTALLQLRNHPQDHVDTNLGMFRSRTEEVPLQIPTQHPTRRVPLADVHGPDLERRQPRHMPLPTPDVGDLVRFADSSIDMPHRLQGEDGFHFPSPGLSADGATPALVPDPATVGEESTLLGSGNIGSTAPLFDQVANMQGQVVCPTLNRGMDLRPRGPAQDPSAAVFEGGTGGSRVAQQSWTWDASYSDAPPAYRPSSSQDPSSRARIAPALGQFAGGGPETGMPPSTVCSDSATPSVYLSGVSSHETLSIQQRDDIEAALESFCAQSHVGTPLPDPAASRSLDVMPDLPKSPRRAHSEPDRLRRYPNSRSPSPNPVLRRAASGVVVDLKGRQGRNRVYNPCPVCQAARHIREKSCRRCGSLAPSAARHQRR